MFSGQMMTIIIAVGAAIALFSSIFIIIIIRRKAGGWAEMKSPLYYAQSPLAIALVLAGVANAMLPPKNLPIAGKINQSITDITQIEKGYHCLFEASGSLHHPGISADMESFQDRFVPRERFTVQGQSISPLSRDGLKNGFHLYGVTYTHLDYKSGERIPTPRSSQRTFWVAHESCNAALRGDSTYGVFDPLSYINLNDWFGT